MEYRVSKGKTLKTSRGVLREGTELTHLDLVRNRSDEETVKDAKARFEELVRAGMVEKVVTPTAPASPVGASSAASETTPVAAPDPAERSQKRSKTNESTRSGSG